MKKISRIATLLIAVVMSMSLLVACVDDTPPVETTKFTVSFDANGRADAVGVPKALTGIEESTTIAKPNEPTSPSASFGGWYKEQSCINEWKFGFDKVTSNITLFAKWTVVATEPTMVQRVPFSDSISFELNNAQSSDVIKVSVDGVEVSGSTIISVTTVVWTPSSDIVSGTKSVVVTVARTGSDISSTTANVVFTDFNGNGSKESPYLIETVTLMDELTSYTGSIGADKFFTLNDDLSINSAKVGNVFEGTFNGQNKKLTLITNDEANRRGVFETIGESGTISDVEVASAISPVADFETGALANVNNGKIDNCTNTARIARQNSVTISGETMNYDTKYGRAGDLSTLDKGGLGGIVRTNNAKGVITNSTNSANIATDIGAGGIAAINYGVISDCANGSPIGSNATITTAPGSLRFYSYGGGIAGINYGTVANSRNSSNINVNFSVEKIGAVAVPASLLKSVVELNVNLGSVVGFNAQSGVVTECVAGSQNIRGYSNVGGIVGNNAGTISYSYNEANRAQNIFGSTNIGGIAGNNSGTINGCYAIFNNVTVGTLVTNPSVYAISNGTVTNSVYTAVAPINGTALTAPTGTTNLVATKSTMPAYNNVIFFAEYEQASEVLNRGLSSDKLMFTMAGQLTRQVEKVTADFEAIYLPSIDANTTLPSTINAYENEILLKPQDPVSDNAGYVFEGWYTDVNGTVEAVFGERLTTSVKLYAKFVPVAIEGDKLSDVAKSNELFSNSIEFAYIGTNTVKFFLNDIEITGSTIELGNNVFKFTPSVPLQYGTQTIRVSDGNETITLPLHFGGAGTEANPYAVTTEEEFRSITSSEDGTVGTGKYYILLNDLTLTTTVSNVTVFDGTFDGNDKKITLENVAPLKIIFHTIGANGTVKNLTNASTANAREVGSSVFGTIAIINNGTIDNVTTGTAGASTTVSKTANISEAPTTIITDVTSSEFVAFGGIVGINNGVVKNSTNYLRMNTFTATGGIAGYNSSTGRIINCVNSGRIGANGHSGNENASYVGGIVSMNFGSVEGCSLIKGSDSSMGSVGGIGAKGKNNLYNGGIVAFLGETGTVSGCSVGAGAGIGGKNYVGTLVGLYVQSSSETGLETLRLGGEGSLANTVDAGVLMQTIDGGVIENKPLVGSILPYVQL